MLTESCTFTQDGIRFLAKDLQTLVHFFGRREAEQWHLRLLARVLTVLSCLDSDA